MADHGDEEDRVEELQEAHRHSLGNVEEVVTGGACWCFHCEVRIEDPGSCPFVDGTALCPRCNMDTVISESCLGTAPNSRVDSDFIHRMNQWYFSEL